MKRRDLIKTAIASSFFFLGNQTDIKSFQSNDVKKIKPQRLKPGDKIGIVAPATFAPKTEEIDRAIQAVEALNLVPVFGSTFRDKTGWRTKPIELRTEELMEMFINPEIKGIFCIRGGYGSIGIVDKLNYSLIAKNPKIFLGYSDITTLLINIFHKTGLVTLHSPMLLSNYDGSFELLKQYLFSNKPIGLLKNSHTDEIRKKNYYTIKSGIADGEIIGGNLSIITSLIGSEYEIKSEGKILFLEDVGEEPYRIDRMLHQLRLAKKLDNIKGLVFGLCTDCEPKGFPVWDKSLLDVLIEHFGGRNYPSFYGLTIGHTFNQIPLPVGVNSRLDSTDGTINILENYCE